MGDRYRVVLLEDDEYIYRKICTLIEEIETISCELTRENKIDILTVENCDFYLVDDKLFSTENKSSSEIFLARLGNFLDRVNPAPVILLSEDDRLGRQALTLGAADYLKFSQLNASILEKSLLLALARRNTEVQLQSYRNQTRQLQAEIALYQRFGGDWQQREKQMQRLMDALPVCIAYIEVQRCYQFVNQNYENWFGYKKEDIYGKHLKEVIGEDAYNKVTEKIDRVLAGEEIVYETRLPYKQGGSRYVSGALIPDFGEDGRVEGYYALISDISHRKHTEEQLCYRLGLETTVANISRELANSSQANLSRILELLGTAVGASRAYLIRFQEGGKIGIMAREWCDDRTQPNLENFKHIDLTLFPWWYDRLVRHQNIAIPQVEALPDAAKAERNYLLARQVNSILAVPIYNRTGQLWAQLSLDSSGMNNKTWLEEDAQLLQLVGDSIYRYHERIEAEAKLRASREELARSNEDLEQFAYIASHDLQAPLATITSFARLLQHRYGERLDGKGEKYIEYIVASARQMQQQIQDLLEYSRVGQVQQPWQETDCHWAIERAIANLKTAIAQHQATISFAGNLPTLVADRSQLIQLFQNLIGNGIKYRDRHPPRIRIEANSHQSGWLFSVSDNGIGIEPKYRERIFQIFQRLHTPEEYPGTGIGLALCQRIVKHHGGRIWVESELGQGSTFYVFFPKKLSLSKVD